MNWRSAILVLVLIAAPSSIALGHARLLRSEPAAGETVHVAPRVVRLWFSDELNPRRSQVSVWSSEGRRVDDGRGGVDLDDLDRKSMVARLHPLLHGTYLVRWTAVSADDGNMAQGTFRFIVRR